MADVLSLSEEDKQRILEAWQYKCYICLGDIIDPKDICYSRVNPEADQAGAGGIVPLHGFCVRRYDGADPAGAREIARIDRGYAPDFGEIYRGPKEKPRIVVQREKMRVSFEKEVLRLYRCPNTGADYFYHQIPFRFIEASTDDITPEINRGRVVRFAALLKRQVQLNPVICLLTAGRIYLLDGKHRAAAQLLGNENAVIDCKVYVEWPGEALAEAVAAGHGGQFGPERRKNSPLAIQLRRRYSESIRHWKLRHPDRDISEYGLLCEQLGLSRAKAGDRIVRLAAELAAAAAGAADFVGPARKKPLTETMFLFLVGRLIRREPLIVPLTAAENLRAEEHANLVCLLRCIIEEGIAPAGDDGSVRPEILFRTRVMLIWTRLLAEALRQALGRELSGAVCYGERFDTAEERVVRTAVRRLFSHPAWSDPRQAGTLHRRKKQDMVCYLAAAGLTVRCLYD
ncbi:MAG: hypothetical protein ACOX8W_07215 [bacterium]